MGHVRCQSRLSGVGGPGGVGYDVGSTRDRVATFFSSIIRAEDVLRHWTNISASRAAYPSESRGISVASGSFHNRSVARGPPPSRVVNRPFPGPPLRLEGQGGGVEGCVPRGLETATEGFNGTRVRLGLWEGQFPIRLPVQTHVSVSVYE